MEEKILGKLLENDCIEDIIKTYQENDFSEKNKMYFVLLKRIYQEKGEIRFTDVFNELEGNKMQEIGKLMGYSNEYAKWKLLNSVGKTVGI